MLSVAQSSPKDFIGANDKSILRQIEATKGRIASITKEINKVVAVTGKLKLEELEAKLGVLKTSREEEAAQLSRLRSQARRTEGVSMP